MGLWEKRVPTDHMEEPAQAEATILIFDAVKR